MSGDRSYKDDEVRAIIDRALVAQPGGELSHADLLAVGAGVGIAPEAIERATHEVRQARLAETATKRVVSRRRRGFAVHALVFLLLNAAFFLVNFLTTPGEWWFLFSVFGWGLGLLLHAGLALPATVSARRLERELRRLGAASPPKTRIGAAAYPARPAVRVEQTATDDSVDLVDARDSGEGSARKLGPK